MRQLCEALRANTTVISLDLSANHFTDEGAADPLFYLRICLTTTLRSVTKGLQGVRRCRCMPSLALVGRSAGCCRALGGDMHQRQPALCATRLLMFAALHLSCPFHLTPLPCLLCPAGAKALAAALRDGRAPDLIDLDLKDNPQIKEEGAAALVSAILPAVLCRALLWWPGSEGQPSDKGGGW